MGKDYRVKIGEYQVTQAPGSLTTIALGSCVGVALFDPVTKIGGLAHIMLPDSRIIRGDYKKTGKFADLALPEMIDEMKKLGAGNQIRAKIAGGASMFSHTSDSSALSIGERNIQAVKKELEKLEIPLLSENTGSNIGRSMKFDLKIPSVLIRTATREYFEL